MNTTTDRLAADRLAVLSCPQWAVVVAGCGGDEPVAVVHANRVVARSMAAADAGVRLGQRRREAQARCPYVRLVPHEPAAEARAFQRVVESVAQLVPRLEITRSGVLTFAARGPSRYFGGDEAMARRVTEVVLDVLGDSVRAVGRPGVGVADGRFAAGVAARLATRNTADHSGPYIVAAGASPVFLAPLSLRWLVDVGDVTVDQVELFRRLGLRSLGDVAVLAEADVMARFGRPGVAARRMAAGLDDRPPDAEHPPPGLLVMEHFDEPVQHLEVVVFAARRLAGQVVTVLSGRGRVCTQFVVVAETDHGERSERLWSLSSGFSVTAMVDRVRWQLDGWASIGEATQGAAEEGITAGIVNVSIEPVEVRADDGMQLGLWGGRTQADEWAQRAAARLAGLVGDAAVVVPEWRGGRHPADRYHWVPASLSARLDPGATAASAPASPASPASGPWPGALPMPSPAVVYPEPRPVDVVDADGTPVVVSGRGVVSAAPARMSRLVISAWAGPWVLEERWWDATRHRRVARFQLLTADGRAFLAAVERRQWWLLAEYC